MVFDEWMDGRMDGQPETNMLQQLLRSWGHNYTEIFLFYICMYFVEILLNFKANLKQSVL